jgi:hypothetical protein
MERNGKQSGTRQMIELLKLSSKHGHSRTCASGSRSHPGDGHGILSVPANGQADERKQGNLTTAKLWK